MSVRYKLGNIALWNEVIPRYHRRMNKKSGPAQSSEHLVNMMGISPGQRVLDVACGSGAVTRLLSERVGATGTVIGTDTSVAAIAIARRICKNPNTGFVNADAENFGFGAKFDAITCQFALFFFPNARIALGNMRRALHESGKIGITVHGRNTPFYSSIIDVITEFIPDYTSSAVKLDRYNTASALGAEICGAGFRRIRTVSRTFEFCAGTFEKYWRDYIGYIAKPARQKLDGLSYGHRRRLKGAVREAASKYLQSDGTLAFPWQVLISTARI